MSSPYFYGVLALGVLWLIAGIFGGLWNPLNLAIGYDGRFSTSKFQWWLWTAVVFFSYTVLYSARALAGNFDPIAEIPANVLYVMGISTLTMAAAKGVTVSAVGKGFNVKPDAADKKQKPSLKQVVTDDNGVADLSKIQIVAWTLLVSAIYIIQVVHAVPDGGDIGDLPDIDRSLMLLMGFGSGGYLARKIVSPDSGALVRADAGKPAGPA